MVKNQGHTLIEAAVIIGILAILFGFGPKLLILVSRGYYSNRTHIALQRDGQVAIDLISRELKEARVSTVVIDNATGEPLFSRVTFTKANGNVSSIYQQGALLNVDINGKSQMVTDALASLFFLFPDTSDLSTIHADLSLKKDAYKGEVKSFNSSLDVQLQNQ